MDKQIVELTDGAIGVVVPDGSTGFDIWESTMSLRGYKKGDVFLGFIIGKESDSILLPKEDWQILGLGNQLTEEQWKGIVEGFCFSSGRLIKAAPNKFMNYENKYSSGPDAFYDDPKKSGLSLLKYKGLKPENTLILKKES